MGEYEYTRNWFLNSEIRRILDKFLNKTEVNRILEIGSFEGLSSVFFADNFLDNPLSRLTCIDPFLTIDNNDHKPFFTKLSEKSNEEKRFDYNISICKNADKISVHKITSDDFFKENKQSYTFIYIDGCHEPEYILRDMENGWKILENEGIMWMDDYKGGDGIRIKNAMNAFLAKYTGQFKLIHIGYQLAIKKLSEPES